MNSIRRNQGTGTVVFLACLSVLAQPRTNASEIRLGDAGLQEIEQDWSPAQKDKSIDGHPLSIGGVTFEHGVGSHADMEWPIDLHGSAVHFTARLGVDDEVAEDSKSEGEGAASVVFVIVGDDKTLFESKPMRVGNAAVPVDVDLRGIEHLTLRVRAGGSTIHSDHADWADAVIQYNGARPGNPPEVAEILTPPAPAVPRINGASVVGVRPDHPLLYTIAATGDRPMTFAVDGLPSGLHVDASTGFISGAAAGGSTIVHVTATNARGKATRDLKIIVGEQIALTPPMGWNSWNCFGTAVSDAKVRSAADAMVASGLIQHGWTYINVDDGWEVRESAPALSRRGSDGHIRTNVKFPDMRAMADYVHGKGLRAGLYSSPGPSTCGGFTGSYLFEERDARSYADWGFDFLKYDWCSYGAVATSLKEQPNPPAGVSIDQQPYRVMQAALVRQNRDIVYSLCQYGMGDVWKWGDAVGGNCWRTTGDITDTWRSMSKIGFTQQIADAPFARPGNWNDPDMLVIGQVGWGPSLHPTHLRPNEQYTHISLWCLLSAPLLIGCDMTQMDDFTKSLLTNDEVIAIDQDPLGKQAVPVARNSNETEVWSKPLADGTHAVGLFNRGNEPTDVTVNWSELGVDGSHAVRDLWRQKNLGASSESFKANVGRHGVVLVKIS